MFAWLIACCGVTGYQITGCVSTHEQTACVMSMPTTQSSFAHETQEALLSTSFPSAHLKVAALAVVPCLVYLALLTYSIHHLT